MQDVRDVRAAHPGLPVVTYVDTSAAVKAESDVCCTSDDAVPVLLTGERVALDLPSHLSGVATATAELVDAVACTGAAVCCTRTTTPGLRALEKAAVRAGGGANHRFGLDDAVLVKDGHPAFAGGMASASTTDDRRPTAARRAAPQACACSARGRCHPLDVARSGSEIRRGGRVRTARRTLCATSDHGRPSDTRYS
ncbi:nicotinate-nucleotide diphosphorylase [Mobilicoccus pelagius]|uniref:Quinolinate phosphoribosyl transferase C-terminal domain-containing protein n=1 Tax=Mobilicoccus pelagius NBRC 104925 TaxID=1089455 RepID=H5UPW1_9MICO|nr:hypothetical protein MOPEL_029_00450 [Mobilicoccus pelagius NBRC 104925]